MRFNTRLKPSLQLIDMTPIVDVVFLLLIFFIVTSDTLPLKSLPVSTPTLPLTTTPLTTQLVVVVDAQEVIYVGSKKTIVELDTLAKELSHEVERYQSQHADVLPAVVLHIDKHVPYGTFLQVFYAAQQLDIPLRLTYHTPAEEEAYATSLP
jgi:biopolymer transport protein ExbD